MVEKRWRLEILKLDARMTIHVRMHVQRPMHEAPANTPAHVRARRDVTADAGADASARAQRTKCHFILNDILCLFDTARSVSRLVEHTKV